MDGFLVPLASRRSGGGAAWVLVWSVSGPGGGLWSAVFQDVVFGDFSEEEEEIDIDDI